MSTFSQVQRDTLPLVSVIIPAFNHEKFVVRCLQSLLEDGYPNLEVLLVDDGSVDATFAVANDWLRLHGNRFRRVYTERQGNRGIAATLNKLVRLANGEYLTLLASDDYLLPSGIWTRLTTLNEHSEWLAVIGDCIVVDDDGRKIYDSGISELRKGNVSLLENPLSITGELLLRWSVPGPVLLLKKITFDEIHGVGMYDESLLVEDKDFYLRLLSRKALGFVNAAVSAYRIHGSNLSSANAGTNNRRVVLLLDLAQACRKNLKLFSGKNRYILVLQALAYELKAEHTSTGSLLYKVMTSILWRILTLLYLWHTRNFSRH